MTSEDKVFNKKWKIQLSPFVPLKKDEVEPMKEVGTKIIKQLVGVDWHISIHALLSVLETTCFCVNEEIEKRK